MRCDLAVEAMLAISNSSSPPLPMGTGGVKRHNLKNGLAADLLFLPAVLASHLVLLRAKLRGKYR